MVIDFGFSRFCNVMMSVMFMMLWLWKLVSLVRWLMIWDMVLGYCSFCVMLN